ncbi:MAG: response regulator [Anaerolineae bacterium]|nr:response regulator [Anaerolineae bacterium]
MEKCDGSVLVVDDEPIVREMMEGFLAPVGYDVICVESGPEALEQIGNVNPDVILLDVMMPDMSGFELCERLKADKRWQHIPIILVTALSSKDDLVRGFDAGADDFLNKPVDSVELRARVRSLLRVKKQYDELESTLRLREDLTHMIVHDIRTPLTAILGYSELLLVRNTLSAADAEDVSSIQQQAYRLNEFLNDMLILAKLEAEKLILNRSMVNMNELVQQIKTNYDVVAQSKRISFVADLSPESQLVLLDANLFQRVLENLISNALKFSPSESMVALQVSYPQARTLFSSSVPRVRIKIMDQGPGITEEYRNRIFDKYEIVRMDEGRDPQIGLGLAFCKMVIEAHGGRIFVEPNQPTGSIFIVEI